MKGGNRGDRSLFGSNSRDRNPWESGSSHSDRAANGPGQTGDSGPGLHTVELFRSVDLGGTSARRQRVALAVGVLSLSGALAVVAGYGTATGLASVLDALLANRLVVSLVALAAGALTVASVWREAGADPEVAVPDPEGADDGSEVVGGDIDESLDALGDASGGAGNWRRSRVRRSVYSTAMDLLIAEGLSPQEAKAHLASGEWTDDERAAAFLGDPGEHLSPRTRLVDWASGEPYRRRVEAAVAELRARADGGAGDGDGDPVALDYRFDGADEEDGHPDGARTRARDLATRGGTDEGGPARDRDRAAAATEGDR